MAEYNYYKIKECATRRIIGTFYGDTTQMYNLCNSINVNWKDNKGKVAVAEVVREGNYRRLTKNLAKKLLNEI
ncbi:MAG: hypothetical protein V1663_02495, partial [archaeon]